MYKLTFKIIKSVPSKEYSRKPVDYSDGGELYYRENEDTVWQVATPPARYRARQDCYEKFGKETFLKREKAPAKDRAEIETYYNEQVKIYEAEEKTNEK